MKIEDDVPGQEKNQPENESFGRSAVTCIPRSLALRRREREAAGEPRMQRPGGSRGLQDLAAVHFAFYIPCLLLDTITAVARRCLNGFNPASIIMPFSPFLRITSTAPRVGPTVARRSRRAASTLSASAPKAQNSLDSILIANRGEIALYEPVQRIDTVY